MADASPVHLTRASHQASNEISRSLRAHAPVWSNPTIPTHAQLESVAAVFPSGCPHAKDLEAFPSILTSTSARAVESSSFQSRDVFGAICPISEQLLSWIMRNHSQI